jgi:diacylglycerol O-acyltransferase
MALRPILLIDAVWLQLESRSTPMHVGVLLEFTPPVDATSNFLQQWRDEIRSGTDIAAPWNLIPVGGRLPVMRESRNIDLDHHVRLWALPNPGTQRELGEMASWLHSQPLDMHRPLWEIHVIEGLDDGRFAIYTKVHHSLVDGISGMRLIARALSDDPESRTPALWQVGPRTRSKPAKTAPAENRAGALSRAWSSISDAVTDTGRSVAGLYTAASELVRGSSDGEAIEAPYKAPKSALGGHLVGQRRIATQQFDLAVTKRLAKAADCTLNDIVLFLCGTALRNYLSEFAELPEKSLTAGLPVSLRQPDDDRIGTSIGFMVADLGTAVSDPGERLRVIARSTAAAKRHLRKMPPKTLAWQSVLVNGPYIAGLISGLGQYAPTPFNLAISNVPGPSEPLYFNGARLDGMYPISLLTQGTALNITCVSYDGRLNFGFVGARDSLPHLQNIAVLTGEAFEELQNTFEGVGNDT